MPKNIPGTVITQMDAEKKRPVLLFELGLATPLKYAAYISDVVFPTAGNTYTAKAIRITGSQQSLEGQVGRINMEFDNVTKDMAVLARDEDFKGKTLVIKRVYLDQVALATEYNEVFNGYLERPSEIGRQWLTVSATTGKLLNRKTLDFAYQRMCPWIFGGAECDTNSLADLTALTDSGTADSGTTTTLVDSGLTQANDYWNHGEIEITKSGVTYYRKVKDFVAGTDTITFDVAMPFAIDGNCTYVVYKGCDQIWETCKSDNAWGPSADNSANFGGCIHINKEADSN